MTGYTALENKKIVPKTRDDFHSPKPTLVQQGYNEGSG